MASKTNRNLQAKAEKAKRQTRAWAELEFSKPAYNISKAAMREEGETIRRLMQHV